MAFDIELVMQEIRTQLEKAIAPAQAYLESTLPRPPKQFIGKGPFEDLEQFYPGNGFDVHVNYEPDDKGFLHARLNYCGGECVDVYARTMEKLHVFILETMAKLVRQEHAKD